MSSSHASRIIQPNRKRVIQVKGVSESKKAKLEKGVTRQEDMPPCHHCKELIIGAAVQGYNDRWYCLACVKLHHIEVWKESGDSAPTPSDETKPRAVAHDEAHEKRRQSVARAALDKYGAVRRNRVWA